MMKSRIRGSVMGSVMVSCSITAAYQSAHAQPTAETMNTATAPAGSSDNLDEIVVNGIKRGDLILPTTVTSASAYGLDLGVMDTPRNNTLLSKAQLDALNIQNPGGFSYLTSSSYSDASFGPCAPETKTKLPVKCSASGPPSCFGSGGCFGGRRAASFFTSST